MRTASSSSSYGITAQYGAEDLLLRNRHRVVDVDEQRRLARSSPGRDLPGGSSPTDEERRAFVDPGLDVAEHAVALLRGDERAHNASGRCGSPNGTCRTAPQGARRLRRSATAGSSMRVGIAQPCPACMHDTDAHQDAAIARSASSSTIVADLPPSSRNTRFIVAAPFSMIRWPTTVDPVNEIRSTFGDSVSSSPTR